MRLNKETSLVLVILFSIIIIIFIISQYSSSDSEDTIQNAGQDMEEVSNEARIPFLQEGVNVYELENEIFTILGTESVRISTDRSSGSGILWKGSKREVMIITTAHLVSDFEKGKIELWDAFEVAFDETNVMKHDIYDLAIIRIFLEKTLKNSYEGVYSYVNSRDARLGEKVWILDSVYGAGSGISTAQAATGKIYLEDYNAEMYLLYGTGKTGMSGSPVYDEAGYLVGMISGMSEDQSTLAVVPTAPMIEFLESLE